MFAVVLISLCWQSSLSYEIKTASIIINVYNNMHFNILVKCVS